jgi:hypothetical protein
MLLISAVTYFAALCGAGSAGDIISSGGGISSKAFSWAVFGRI